MSSLTTDPTNNPETPQAQDEETGAHFEPVIRLEEKDKIEIKTAEEDEDVTFKMYVHVYKAP